MKKTSKIDAINSMLISVGVRPVNTIVPPHGADVAQALHTLDEVSREVQERGWKFNRIVKTLSPDPNTNKIALPENVVRIDSTSPWIDTVQIGEYLYNEGSNTYEFTNSVEVEMVVLREWEELPEAARNYILKRATRIYSYRIRGGQDLQSPSFDEASAMSDLEDADSETADYNIFNNWATYRIIDRGGYRRGLEWG